MAQVTEAQVHDKLALHGLSLDERNAWWKEPLPELNNRTPAHCFYDDPLTVKLLAQLGAIGDRKRMSVLTPFELWPDTSVTQDATDVRDSDPVAGEGTAAPSVTRDPSLPEWWG